MHEHDHEHNHNHEHVHTHEHSHELEEKEYTREEAVALLNYMYQHNTHHADELSELADAFPEHIRYKIEDAVGVLDAANESLKDAIEAVAGEEDKYEECHAEEEHEHTHDHGHVHDPADKKKRLSRISRIIGHLQYVRRMISEDEDCSDILMQISAVKSALNGLGKTVIKEHMSHCIVHAVESGDTDSVQEFQDAIQKYL